MQTISLSLRPTTICCDKQAKLCLVNVIVQTFLLKNQSIPLLFLPFVYCDENRHRVQNTDTNNLAEQALTLHYQVNF